MRSNRVLSNFWMSKCFPYLSFCMLAQRKSKNVSVRCSQQLAKRDWSHWTIHQRLSTWGAFSHSIWLIFCTTTSQVVSLISTPPTFFSVFSRNNIYWNCPPYLAPILKIWGCNLRRRFDRVGANAQITLLPSFFCSIRVAKCWLRCGHLFT